MPIQPVVSIVDDDVNFCIATAGFVRSFGCDVRTFDSASSFLRSGLAARPACLISDIRMPKMSGIELHERLLSLGYAIPVILVTAAETPDTLARARRNGVLAIFPKPFDPTEMQYWLSRALAGDPGFSS